MQKAWTVSKIVICYHWLIKPLLDDRILDQSKLKTFADNEFRVT